MDEIKKPESLALPANSLVKIDTFFDKLERIVERSERLIMKAKFLIFGFAFLLFLIYEMIVFGKYLLNGH